MDFGLLETLANRGGGRRAHIAKTATLARMRSRWGGGEDG